ncbi:MAG: type II toxin-antitoxin system HicA family toxin [Chloroflexia bacterium]|nr:type II toxin-antitoxin system HicA family toxin [Chloroflexia bacterium]
MRITNRDKLVERIRSMPSDARFRDVQSLLEAYGWTHASTKGSHARFTKSGHRSWTVPVHKGV